MGFVLACVALVCGLYALHRLALWLEDRGMLYYTRTKPKGGGGMMSGFVAMQRFVEPASNHVETVGDHTEADAGESGDRPEGGAMRERLDAERES